jgi:hypothetical protein
MRFLRWTPTFPSGAVGWSSRFSVFRVLEAGQIEKRFAGISRLTPAAAGYELALA